MTTKPFNRIERKSFLQRIRGRGLASWPDVEAEYEEAFAAFRSRMHRIKFPYVMEHPFYPLKIELQDFFDPVLIFLISIGDYELTDLELYDTYIEKGDVVLDIGGGIGLTAAACYKKSQRKVTIVEPDLRMHSTIKRMGILNNASFEVIAGCVLPPAHTEKTATFYVHREFWRSTATPSGAGEYQKVEVPALKLQDLLSLHKPTTLVMDVEGAEKDLFSQDLADLPKRIFVEIHVPNISEKSSAHVISSISSLGYRLVDFRGWVFYFEKF